MRWRCGKGHEWEAKADHVKNSGHWCPTCNRCGKAPLKLEDLQELARTRGGELLSTSYVGCRAKMLWRCGEGHEWEACANDVKNHGSWCGKCARKSRTHTSMV